MALKLHKLGSDPIKQQAFLIVGKPGVGKTRLAEQAGFLLRKKGDGTPDWSRLLFVNCEAGEESIKHLSDIQVWTPFVDGRPNDLLNALSPANPKLPGSGELVGKFDVVFIDGLDVLMRDVYVAFQDEEQKKPNPNPMAVWGSYGNAMLDWVSRMSRLQGYAKFFTNHVYFDIESPVKWVPNTQGGKILTPDTLTAMFNYVLFMDFGRLKGADATKTPEHRVFRTTNDPKLGGDPKYLVKSRVRGGREPLPAIISAEPDVGLQYIWHHLFEKEE